jgi:hypothetical protein
MTRRNLAFALVILGGCLVIIAAATISIPVAMALAGVGLILLGLLAIEVSP